MKKTLFAVLVAAVAVLATSCQKKGDAPKALFTYENDGLVVTFTNASTGADSYSWDFGDQSQASTEVNPVHIYTSNGDYTVVLTAKNAFGETKYQETVTLAVPAIAIDGDFTDWAVVIADGSAVHTALETGKEYEGDAVKEFAAYMDADFIYFMLAYDATQVMPLDMYLGCSGERVDESPCTHYWDPMYCDYLVEFGKGDTFTSVEAEMDWYDWTYCTLFAFDHETGGWAFNQLAQQICTISDKVAKSNITYVEGKMSRANFTQTAAYVYICCNTSDSGWGGSGFAPCPEVVEGSSVYPAQLKLVEATIDK